MKKFQVQNYLLENLFNSDLNNSKKINIGKFIMENASNEELKILYESLSKKDQKKIGKYAHLLQIGKITKSQYEDAIKDIGSEEDNWAKEAGKSLNASKKYEKIRKKRALKYGATIGGGYALQTAGIGGVVHGAIETGKKVIGKQGLSNFLDNLNPEKVKENQKKFHQNKKTKTGKIMISAGAILALSGTIMGILNRYTGEAKRFCSKYSGERRTNCMDHYRYEGVKAALSKLHSEKSKCSDEKCINKINKLEIKLNKKLKDYED